MVFSVKLDRLMYSIHVNMGTCTIFKIAELGFPVIQYMTKILTLLEEKTQKESFVPIELPTCIC